jgi:sugar lactone lactonase YvrE
VAVDSAGNIYVTDGERQTIRKITVEGVVTTLAGSPGQVGSDDGVGSAARFHEPNGIAVDDTGNLYVAEGLNHTIRKISPAGEVTTLAGSPGLQGSDDGMGTGARFNHPWGLALDKSGNIYLADVLNNTIRRITPDGLVSTLAGNASITDGNGNPLAGFVDGIGSAALFSSPQDLAVDNAGNLYVTDSGNNAIRMITPAGAVTTIGGGPEPRGSADGVGRAAQFSALAGIAVDSGGTIYATDSNRISKGTPLLGPGAPQLQITRGANGLRLAWPSSATGFALESRTALDASGNWVPESSTGAMVGGQNLVTIQADNLARFFRLRKQ